MIFQEPKTLHHICELEKAQLLTLLAVSDQLPKLSRYLLTANHSNFFYVEGSTA